MTRCNTSTVNKVSYVCFLTTSNPCYFKQLCCLGEFGVHSLELAATTVLAPEGSLAGFGSWWPVGFGLSQLSHLCICLV